jgi:hypothetical protein
MVYAGCRRPTSAFYRRTKALIADPTVPAIFEATMVYDPT